MFHHIHKAPVSRLGGLGLAISFAVTSLTAFAIFGEGGFPVKPHTVADLQVSPTVESYSRPVADTSPQQTGKTSASLLTESKQPALVVPWTQYVICVSALAMFLLGFWDDLKPLGAKRKLFAQVLIASAACHAGLQVQTFHSPFGQEIYDLGLLGPIVTVIWLVTLTNLINMIDGIGGPAGGIALMLMSLLCWAGMDLSLAFPVLCAVGMAGSLIGFLRYNSSTANIYMGDGGAYFLGFLIGALSIMDSNKGTIVAALLAPLLALALPILDVAMAICRRGLKGLPIFQRGLGHLRHKLLDLGYNPRRAVLFLYSLSVIFLLLGLVVFCAQGKFTTVGLGLGCLVLIIRDRSFNFSREWCLVGRVSGNSLEIREAIRHALTLSEWLEMEAKRCDTLENLWGEFSFLAMKHGFSQVTLNLRNTHRVWESENCGRTDNVVRHRHEFAADQQMSLEFEMPTGAVDTQLFNLLCGIASEAWHKSTARWSISHSLPIDFVIASKPSQPAGGEQNHPAYVPAASAAQQGRVYSPISPEAPTPQA